MTAQFLAGATERTHCRPAWGQVVGGLAGGGPAAQAWTVETRDRWVGPVQSWESSALSPGWGLVFVAEVCVGGYSLETGRGGSACRDRQGVGAQAWGPLAPGEGGRRAEWPWT